MDEPPRWVHALLGGSVFAVVLAIVVVGVVLPALDNGSGAPSGYKRSLAAAKGFRGYTIYWLGRSFRGLPLTEIVHQGRAWNFIYGTCHASSDDGCASPLDIQNWSICRRFPEQFPGSTLRANGRRATQALPAGGGLDVYAGRTTIAVFGQHEAMRSLRRVRDGVKRASLPAPRRAALAGKLPCQDRAMERLSR